MIRYKLHAKNLQRVFNDGSLLQAHIARLCVLFEDLRIETYGIIEESLPSLDFTDEAYRRNYFLRRSIATVFELAEELRLLDQLDDFKKIKSSFDKVSLRHWDKAVKFFGRYESYFRRIRNDIGGHFGLNAARYSL